MAAGTRPARRRLWAADEGSARPRRGPRPARYGARARGSRAVHSVQPGSTVGRITASAGLSVWRLRRSSLATVDRPRSHKQAPGRRVRDLDRRPPCHRHDHIYGDGGNIAARLKAASVSNERCKIGSRSATNPESSPLWMKIWPPTRQPAVPKATYPRPLAGLSSSKSAHENSAQAAPSRDPSCMGPAQGKAPLVVHL